MFDRLYYGYCFSVSLFMAFDIVAIVYGVPDDAFLLFSGVCGIVFCVLINITMIIALVRWYRDEGYKRDWHIDTGFFISSIMRAVHNVGRVIIAVWAPIHIQLGAEYPLITWLQFGQNVLLFLIDGCAFSIFMACAPDC